MKFVVFYEGNFLSWILFVMVLQNLLTVIVGDIFLLFLQVGESHRRHFLKMLMLQDLICLKITLLLTKTGLE